MTDTEPTEPMTNVPNYAVPARVLWQDQTQPADPAGHTHTTWAAEDADGNASTLVTATPLVDDDQQAMLNFATESTAGVFRVVASTTGRDGQTLTARSGLYNIVPGVPQIGQIHLEQGPQPAPVSE